MNSTIRYRVAGFAVAVITLISASIAAAADVTGGANGVSVSRGSSNGQSVRMTGPNGYVADSWGTSQRSSNGALADGTYRFEVTETQCGGASVPTHNNAANGRAANAKPSSCREVVVDSGAFRIVNGAVPSNALVER